MRSPLVYLTATRLKNQLKSLVKSPAKLTYAIILVLLMGFVVFSGNQGMVGAHFRDRAELGAIATAFYLLMFTLVANSGFSTGASVFKMSDVNFLFPGPFPRQRVLFYGLFQQLGTSLLMAVVMLFQYGWMRSAYGVTVGDMLVLIIGYGLTVFTAQLAAMLIYALTASSEKKRRVARAIFVLIPAAYALWIFRELMGAEGAILPRLVELAGSLAMRLYPVAGWLGGAAGGLLAGDWAQCALGLGIWLLVLLAAVILLRLAVPDYYEDVLQSTETAFANQAAAKEGRITEAGPKKVKAGKTGLSAGWGAAAFYAKHRVENRRSRKFILSGTSLIMAVCVIAFSFFMRNMDSAGFVGVIFFSAYLQVFTVSLGRVVKELTKPYVYLVPEPPVKKLLWCIRESLSGFLVEAIVIFVPVCLLFGFGPTEMIACVLMRLGFDYLFLAGNLAGERLFGHIGTKALIMLFYFLLVLLMAVPGIVLAIVLNGVGAVVINSVVTSCLALTVCNLPVALLAIFLCRNLLDNVEMHG